jgi:rRNA-processing protein FCF1
MDASALLAPFQLGIDFERWIRILVDSKVEISVLSKTLAELEKLSRSSSKLASDASKALVLAGRYRVIQSSDLEDGDECLINAAKRYNCAVATCDRSLRKKLRDLNIPVFSPTDRGKIRVEGLRP